MAFLERIEETVEGKYYIPLASSEGRGRRKDVEGKGKERRRWWRRREVEEMVKWVEGKEVELPSLANHFHFYSSVLSSRKRIVAGKVAIREGGERRRKWRERWREVEVVVETQV